MASPLATAPNPHGYDSEGDVVEGHPLAPMAHWQPLIDLRCSSTGTGIRVHWRIVVLMIAGGVIAGCHWGRHEPPAPRDFDGETTIPADIDAVWNAVIDVFGERDWPIDHMERASGFISTDWITSGWLTPAPHVGYLDCGEVVSPGRRDRPSRREGRFNVVVRESDDGVVLKINSTWRAYRDAERVNCVSTGLIENELHADIRARTSP